MTGFRLEELTGHQYAEAGFDKAILAIGSTECHGRHLPHGTDTLVPYSLALEVAGRVEGLLVLPPVHYGMSEQLMDFPMTLTLQPETLMHMVVDILISLWRQQIYRVIVLSGHDGDLSPIDMAARSVKVAHPEMRLAVLDAWWVKAGELLPEGTFETFRGLGHGGEGETSIALALFPQLVQMEYARGSMVSLPRHLTLKTKISELTASGATGAPEKATPEKGEMMKNALVTAVVDFVRELESAGWEYGIKHE